MKLPENFGPELALLTERLTQSIGQLAKILKGACASGGTVKGRTIELQGNHKKKAAKVLEQNGYQVEVR